MEEPLLSGLKEQIQGDIQVIRVRKRVSSMVKRKVGSQNHGTGEGGREEC